MASSQSGRGGQIRPLPVEHDSPEWPSTWQTLQKILAPVASLKLAVALFALAILLIFFGTLAQYDKDIWQVIHEYFRTPLAFVAFKDLVPGSLFPNRPEGPIGFSLLGRWIGGFYFPGGWLIGGLMGLNLLAAHAIRFKLQARGIRLWAGLGVIAAGVLVTTLVVASGSNKEGVQQAIWAQWEWDTLWTILKWGLGALWVGVASTLLSIPTTQKSQRRVIVTLTVLLGAFVAWLFVQGDSARLDDSGMRILWQLIKAEFAAAVLLLGCIMVFRKRGGVVLLHAGIGLMMFGELLTGLVAEEAQMVIQEGETVNYAQDIRQVELAIVDRSGEEHDVHTAIPESRLLSGKVIEGDDLPFEIEVVEFIDNSVLQEIQGEERDNPATRGAGRHYTVARQIPSSGTDSEEVDMAAAYVRLIKDGTPMGTWLVSQQLKPQEVFLDRSRLFTIDMSSLLAARGPGSFKEKLHAALRENGLELSERFDLQSGDRKNEWKVVDGNRRYVLVDHDGGKTEVYGADYVTIDLRFKRNYKSFSMHLKDVRKQDYIGTTKPKSYESELQLVDTEAGIRRDVKIWMNNPLRYAGETFYQSGYAAPPKAPVETTTLQVVTNTGWMIPYVGCMIVATGMLYQFWLVLLRFLNRGVPGGPMFGGPRATAVSGGRGSAGLRHGPAQSQSPALSSVQANPWVERMSVILPAIVVLAAAGVMLWFSLPPRSVEGEMNLDGFGRLPVVYEGRVKPFDSLARNSLRVISKKQSFEDEYGEKQPALRWFLDLIAKGDQADNYEVFRIEDMQVLFTLGLERQKGFRYAFADFEDRMGEFRSQVVQAGTRHAKARDYFDRKVLKTNETIQLYFRLRHAHQLPPEDLETAGQQVQYLLRVGEFVKQLNHPDPDQRPHVPFAVPTGSGEQPWEPLITAAARTWLKDLARARGAADSRGLAAALLGDLAPAEMDRLIQRTALAMIDSMVRSAHKDMSDEEVHQFVIAKLRDMSDEHRTALIDLSLRRMRENLEAAFEDILGDSRLDEPVSPAARSLVAILSAYRDGDVEVFNREVENYKALLEEDPPAELSVGRTNFEAWFNHSALFMQSSGFYLIAFVLTVLGWLLVPFGWGRPVNRAAFWLVGLVFVVHTAALIARIYISGRPPVTNLYSSAVFIGWGAVVLGIVLELVYRIGIGNAVASAAGWGTLMIADYLAADGDTFTVMQAVLDTQFWLATHVVCITLGYATTFVAGLLGCFYILGGLATPALPTTVGRESLGRLLGRMIYGTLCFAIFFSFVGTVLGGLWADDSWGRFWGWDPKENGALMIVLWNAIVLHARWDGMAKERGLAVLAVGGNIVTAWSWFGVNLLGVGLHSYGFQEGVGMALAWFVASQFGIIAAGSLPTKFWWSFRGSREQGETAG